MARTSPVLHPVLDLWSPHSWIQLLVQINVVRESKFGHGLVSNQLPITTCGGLQSFTFLCVIYLLCFGEVEFGRYYGKFV